MKDFGLYPVITDPVAGYAKCAEAAVRAGVKIIQLRMKHAARAQIVETALEMRRITRGSGTLFIVNDDPSIAAEVEADGVHVGQDDMKPSEVRMLFPELRIVGLSTHNPAQTEASRAEPIDYIGVGPVYATPTKDIPDPTLGLETMARMISLAAHPCVAIGGIDLERLSGVIRSGARTFGVVRAICRNPDPYSAIREIQRIAAEAMA